MENPTNNQFPLDEHLRRRWSPLAFSGELLSQEELGSLMEAARWAPSSYNGQPWSFIMATRDEVEEFGQLASCMVEANQAWANAAPLLILAVARKEFERNGKPNAHARYDVGQAAAYLTFQATTMGLFVHQMAGFVPDRARELYAIPETHDPVAMMAVGRYGDHEKLAPEHRQREMAPRERKPLQEMVYTGRFGRVRALRPPSTE